MIDKRTKILQATADMIAEHGLTCSPMSKISARAGCGAGTIYRYFETKDELVVELFKETAQKLTDACLKNYQGEGSLRDRFFQIWGNYFSYINENPSERALLEQLFASPAIGPCDKESALDQLRSTTFPILDEGKSQGVFKDLPNDVINTFVFGSLAQMSKKFESYPELGAEINSDSLLQLCWDALRQ